MNTENFFKNLVWAVKNGDLEQVRDIIEKKGINVNDMIDGRPPILYAADYGQKEVIEYLVAKGADVNACDKHGISALLAAIWEGHKQVVEFLLQSGASRDGSAPDGTSYADAAEQEDIRALLR